MTSIPRIGPITSSFMSRSKTGKHPFAQASLHDVVAVVAAPPPRHGCAIATTDRPGGGPPTPRRSRSLFLGPASSVPFKGRRERGEAHHLFGWPRPSVSCLGGQPRRGPRPLNGSAPQFPFAPLSPGVYNLLSIFERLTEFALGDTYHAGADRPPTP